MSRFTAFITPAVKSQPIIECPAPKECGQPQNQRQVCTYSLPQHFTERCACGYKACQAPCGSPAGNYRQPLQQVCQPAPIPHGQNQGSEFVPGALAVASADDEYIRTHDHKTAPHLLRGIMPRCYSAFFPAGVSDESFSLMPRSVVTQRPRLPDRLKNKAMGRAGRATSQFVVQ